MYLVVCVGGGFYHGNVISKKDLTKWIVRCSIIDEKGATDIEG